MDTDTPDMVLEKRLLNYTKREFFTFRRIASGAECTLMGYRLGDS